MNIQLLQWGLFCFMIGILLSLPLAAVHYGNNPQLAKLFTNPRKLKSAHLDFFTQAFALGFVYLLENATKQELNMYVVIPLVFGSIFNPTLLLIEATPLIRSGWTGWVYRLLKVASPASLLFAWSVIAFFNLPGYMKLLFLTIVLIGLFVAFTYLWKLPKLERSISQSESSNAHCNKINT